MRKASKILRNNREPPVAKTSLVEDARAPVSKYFLAFWSVFWGIFKSFLGRFRREGGRHSRGVDRIARSEKFLLLELLIWEKYIPINATTCHSGSFQIQILATAVTHHHSTLCCHGTLAFPVSVSINRQFGEVPDLSNPSIFAH